MDLYQNRKLKDIRARLAELKRLEQEHREGQSQIATQRGDNTSKLTTPTAPNCTLNDTLADQSTGSFDIVDQFHTATGPFTVTTHGKVGLTLILLTHTL